jgi:serine/threonine protein kinase/tetratricopeptide (TPR) repeat protein
MLGQTISHYRILERLGAGGMGDVYLALDEALERRVALKFLKGELSQNANYKKILTEARAAAAVDHPFVCKVYEASEIDGQAFLVLEYVSGLSLQERLKQGPLPAGEAVKYACEVTEALMEVHHRALVHLDIKPGNIMITRQGHAKLMDFGLATSMLDWVPPPPSEDFPGLPRIAGSPAYMAPEQIRGKKVDSRADIFALGITLHEMLTASHPFRRDSIVSTITAILGESYSTPPADKLDPALAEIITRAVEKNPANRFATIEELNSRLRRWAEKGLPVSSPRKGHTIAILPFIDLSPQKDQGYFCVGFAEGILNALGKVDDLNVVSPTSSFRFRGTEDIREVGRSLNATVVLEGCIRKTTEQVQIMATLRKVDDGIPLWSDQHDCQVDDVATVQKKFAEAITMKLCAKSQGRSSDGNFEGSRIVEPAAYDLYLRGRHCWNDRTPLGLRQSLEYYKMASEIDPRYPEPYAGLALSYVTLSIYGAMRPSEAMVQARCAAEQALELDRTAADAIAALGCIAAVCDWKWDRAEDYFKEAIAADPKNGLTRQWYAINLLAPLGRFDAARAEIERASVMDPASPLLSAVTGLLYYFERRYSLAVDHLTRALNLDPALAITHYFLSQVYLAQNDYPKAIDHAEKAITFSAGNSESLALLACAYAPSDTSATLELLEKLQSRMRDGYVSPVLLAQIHLALRDSSRSLDLLEQAVTWRATELTWIRVRPLFDPLRKNPVFLDLCKRIGFPVKV